MNAKQPEPRLSVLVLTRNRLDVLRNCLKSILRQQNGDFEIVVLDDASDEMDTAAAVAEEFADTRLRAFHAERSLGVAGGRNLLMEKARGELLVFIDDDAIFVRDDALDEVCRTFQNEPTVGIASFKITNVVGGSRSPLMPILRASAARNPEIVSQRAFVSCFRGCGHAIRRSIIDEHGGYRPDMVYGGEEWDLSYRVIRAGYQILHVPSVEVDHFHKPSVIGGVKNRASSEVLYQLRNHAYLAYRYLPWKYAFPYMGVWMWRCAIRSLRDENVFNFVRGALATPSYLRGVKREVLDRRALAYLTKHGGGRGTIY